MVFGLLLGYSKYPYVVRVNATVLISKLTGKIKNVHPGAVFLLVLIMKYFNHLLIPKTLLFNLNLLRRNLQKCLFEAQR